MKLECGTCSGRGKRAGSGQVCTVCNGTGFLEGSPQEQRKARAQQRKRRLAAQAYPRKGRRMKGVVGH